LNDPDFYIAPDIEKKLIVVDDKILIPFTLENFKKKYKDQIYSIKLFIIFFSLNKEEEEEDIGFVTWPLYYGDDFNWGRNEKRLD
jgi:hypothetical protein